MLWLFHVCVRALCAVFFVVKCVREWGRFLSHSDVRACSLSGFLSLSPSQVAIGAGLFFLLLLFVAAIVFTTL